MGERGLEGQGRSPRSVRKGVGPAWRRADRQSPGCARHRGTVSPRGRQVNASTSMSHPGHAGLGGADVEVLPEVQQGRSRRPCCRPVQLPGGCATVGWPCRQTAPVRWAELASRAIQRRPARASDAARQAGCRRRRRRGARAPRPRPARCPAAAGASGCPGQAARRSAPVFQAFVGNPGGRRGDRVGRDQRGSGHGSQGGWTSFMRAAMVPAAPRRRRTRGFLELLGRWEHHRQPGGLEGAQPCRINVEVVPRCCLGAEQALAHSTLFR